MQTIGQMVSETAPNRYATLSIKNRILLEIQRRLQTNEWALQTVKQWDKVVIGELEDEEDDALHAAIGVFDGQEDINYTAQKYENSFDVIFEFQVRPGEKEVPRVMLNQIQADIVETIAGDDKLREGGDGEQLAASMKAIAYEPDVVPDEVPRGLLTFRCTYRHVTHRPRQGVGT